MPCVKRKVIILSDDDEETDFVHSEESTVQSSQPSQEQKESCGNRSVSSKRLKLDSLLMEQEKSLTPLRAQRVDIYHTKKRKQQRISGDIHSASPQELWKRSIDDALREDPHFFSSEEAWMRTKKRAKRGQPAYRSVRVSLWNCMDLKNIHSVRYFRCVSSGRGSSSFGNMKTIFGQIARFMITCGDIDACDGWKEGKILKVCDNLKVLKCFLNFFSINASPSTVAVKANLIIALCKFAKLHTTDEEREKRIELVINHMNVRATESKTQARQDTNARLVADARIRNQTLVTEAQMAKGIRTAIAKLKDMRSTFLKDVEEGGSALKVRLLKKPELLNKWCINFCGLLVLVGGGQRPQAFSQLQAPTVSELEDMEESEAADSMIMLRTLGEKTVRSYVLPGVSFPYKIFPFLRLHVEHIREIILAKCEVSENKGDHPLLLHTVHGDYLSVTNITNTVKKFMRNIDPDLTNVTTMTLRACYATSCLHKYREGKTGHGLSEGQYLEHLARRMNTSVEQLRNVYAAVYEKDVVNAMRTAMDHLSVIMNE